MVGIVKQVLPFNLKVSNIGPLLFAGLIDPSQVGVQNSRKRKVDELFKNGGRVLYEELEAQLPYSKRNIFSGVEDVEDVEDVGEE